MSVPLITICHRCPRAKHVPPMQMVCTADVKGRDISELAEHGFCPLGKFPGREAGDWVALAAHVTGITRVVEAVNGGKPCGGCAKRHEQLNEASRKLKEQNNG